MGAVVTDLGHYLTSPLGARELSAEECDVISYLTRETHQTELETPHGRKLSFPWKPAVRLASDFFALDSHKVCHFSLDHWLSDPLFKISVIFKFFF